MTVPRSAATLRPTIVERESHAAPVELGDFETGFEDGLIFRRDRRPTLTLHADPTSGESTSLPLVTRPMILLAAFFRAQSSEGGAA